MNRKFFFCFPLRAGNIVFGYVVITLCLAVIAYHLYWLGLTAISEPHERDHRFRDFSGLDRIFGPTKNGDPMEQMVNLVYYGAYVGVALLLLLFSVLYTCGAHKANKCLVSTFFVYSFFHLFLTFLMMVWEALTAGWIRLGLIAAFDVLLIISLFGVKYLMEAIRTGYVYSSPGEVFHKY